MIKLKSLPSKPGVYIYRNRNQEVIYVGKAINLKNRISQYFQNINALGPKTKILVSQITSVETIVVGSEIEALILESSLIKKHRPKYNSLLKDDRSYQYICISKSKIPRVYTAHQSNLPADADIYGPFPNASSVRALLKLIRPIFPYQSQIKHPRHLCLYCHLSLCPGPDPDPKIYRRSLSGIRNILTGRFKFLRRDLENQMKQASKTENFEQALNIRSKIMSLDYVVNGWKNLSTLYQDINLPQDKTYSALSEIKAILASHFSVKNINRIECFDISQTGKNYFVGSMTVALDGQIRKDQFKQFKIRYYPLIQPNDQLMIKEVFFRRLKHPEWGSPDLVVVDGGKPQVSAAREAAKFIRRLHPETKLSKVDIPVIGLAKKEELIVLKSGLVWHEIKLPRHSPGLQLLQFLRDEAHRFANRYRKILTKKSIGLGV